MERGGGGEDEEEEEEEKEGGGGEGVMEWRTGEEEGGVEEEEEADKNSDLQHNFIKNRPMRVSPRSKREGRGEGRRSQIII